MKNELSLDDVLAFLAVADGGGLTAAALETGQSPPTLGRKMTALEQATGRRLFRRGSGGYVLTAEGRAFRAEAEALVEVRARLSSWTRRDGAARVRITAGTWSSRWLARSLTQYWSPALTWMPEFLGSNANLDIARREADIGFRNRRPDQSWLAGRRLRQIRYAEFGTDESVRGYVTLAPNLPGTPSTRWLSENRGDDILTTVTDARLALDLARQGVGRVVLPIFAVAPSDGVSQLSDPIGELTHDEWLVTHHDARNDPPVRRAIDAITDFILKHET